MAEEINWGMIRGGATFEALMQALVFADDPHAKLLDRPGKDKGVDALSGDGLTVFQAKYGEAMNMDEVIKRAEGEMEKIRKHLADGDVTWGSVRHWILYANVPENTWDVEKWERFKAEFQASLKIDAECRGVAYMNQQLIDHPQIRQLFFEGRNRCLLYESETYEKLAQQSFHGCFHKTQFVGRDRELAQLFESLENPRNRAAFVRGRHEVGRTRFLFEIMSKFNQQGIRTFWGLAASMRGSDSWYENITLGERAVIIVDDCDQVDLLDRILEQLFGAGHEKVQFVISYSTESAGKIERRLRALTGVVDVHLQPLRNEVMMELVQGYENFKPKPEVVGGICGLANGFPGWAAFIITARAKTDQSTVMTLAGDVLATAFEDVSESLRGAVRTVARWIALWGCADFESNGLGAFFSRLGLEPTVLEECLCLLADKGIIVRSVRAGSVYRFVNRILQHEILLEWLIDIRLFESGRFRVNAEGKKLIEMLIRGELPFLDAALETLARMSLTHFPEKDAETFIGPILADLYDKLKNVTAVTALDEAYAFEVVSKIGACDPKKALDVLRCLHNLRGVDSPMSDRFNGKWTLSAAQIRARIPALAGEIADGIEDPDAAKSYLGFLLDLWENAKLRGESFDSGNEPDTIVQRLLTTSRQPNPYHRLVRDYLNLHFGEIASSFVLTSMMSWMFTMRLSRTYSPINLRIVLEHAWVSSGTELWAYREELRTRIFDEVVHESDPERRCEYWKVLLAEHTALLGACIEAGRLNKEGRELESFQSVIKDDLTRVHKFLAAHDEDIQFDERVELRRIWERHLDRRYTPMPAEICDLADRCEKFYEGRAGCNIQAVYRPDDDSADVKAEVQKVVVQFESAADATVFGDFLVKAENYLKLERGDAESDYGRTEQIAIGCFKSPNLCYQFEDGSPLDEYVCDVLARFGVAGLLEREFVVCILREVFKAVKSADTAFGAYKRVFGRVLDLSRENSGVLMGRVFERTHENSTGRLLQWEMNQLLKPDVGLPRSMLANIVPAYYGVCPDEVLNALTVLCEHSADHGDDIISRIVYCWYIAACQGTLRPDESLLSWIADLVLARKCSERIFYSFRFEYLRDQCGFKYPLSRLNDLIDAGIKFETGFDVNAWFRIGKDTSIFESLCKRVIEDGEDVFFRHYTLPHYLAALEGAEPLLVDFVRRQVQYPGLDVQLLNRCASFAGCYVNTSDAWKQLAAVICTAAAGFDSADRTNVYAHLNPQMIFWHGEVGKVSPDIIRRRENARKQLVGITPNDPVKGYWLYELDAAEDAYKQALAEVEEEEHE